MAKTCFIYCRISQDREGRRIGVGRQQEDCAALAESLGYEVVQVFIDNDISASTRSKKKRPQFEEMMTLAEGHAVDAILSYSSGRLTRRPMESERLIQLYENTGVLIHYKNQKDHDLSTARGRSRARDDARRDAEEVEELSERVERDVTRRAEAGLPHGGNRAFGWTTDHKLDPYEHPILVELAERALSGEAIKSLARDLTERGVPLATWRPPLVLKPWPYQTVRKMLLNPRIAGFRTRHGEIVGKATWPAAVSETTWRQIDALFRDQTRHSGGTSGRVHDLTGLARCGECDRPIGIRNTKSKARGPRVRYWCEPCGLYRAIEPINAYVRSVMITILEHYNETPPAVDPQQVEVVERLRERIQDAEREFALDDTADPAHFRNTLRLMQGRLREEEAKLIPPRRHNVVEGMTGADAEAAWDACPLDRRRAIIDALVEIRIHRAATGRKPFDPETVQILPR